MFDVPVTTPEIKDPKTVAQQAPSTSPTTPDTGTQTVEGDTGQSQTSTGVAAPVDKQGYAGDEYDEVIELLEKARNAYQPETEEQKKVRERKERSKRIVAAVSDGLSALSNLYFTTQYAPDSYERGRGQLRAVNGVIDKIRAERERDADKYLQYSLRLGDLKNQRAKTVREMEAEQERQRLAREEAQRKAEQHNWQAALQPDKQREQSGKADKAEQEAIAARAVAEATPEMQDAKLATEKARRRKLDADAHASSSRAGSYNKTVHHFRGKSYESAKDYTKDVTEAARDYNARHQGEPGFTPIVIERQERTAHGLRNTPRNPEEFAGEVERRLADEENDKRPPYMRKQNENKPPYRK